MKQGKLIRRAVSVALAGCMMFTLSAPALAASTDDLLQQSTAAKSAVSVLDAENGDTVDYGITITIYGKGKVKVDSSNCNNILGFLKYDPDPINSFSRSSFSCAFSLRKLTPIQEMGTHISNRRS